MRESDNYLESLYRIRNEEWLFWADACDYEDWEEAVKRARAVIRVAKAIRRVEEEEGA